MYALINCIIYTGYQILTDHAVIINGDKIETICKKENLPADIVIKDLDGAILAPGFIDLQLNGCGGVQFNETLESLSIETINKMYQTNLLSGCTSFLPTLITSSDEFMVRAVQVMREYLNDHNHQALGLHFEGPYINIEKKGIHDERFIRSPTTKMIDFLCENADVIKMVTLAPEKVESCFVKQLASAGIQVSAGHTNGHYDDCWQGFNAGIGLATHLFNAMPYISGRQPGVVGAVYDAPQVYATIIADGLHVDWANIRYSHKIKQDHLILVTDAMLLANSNLYSCIFGGKTIYYQDGRCVDQNGTLGGSALTMIKAVENIVKYVGVSLDEALRMATLYPARAIHVDHLLGSIEQGKIANLVTLSHDLTVLDTIVNGIITERKSPN